MYRLSTTFWFLSLWYDVYSCLNNSNEQSIFDHRQKIKSMVISMLQNLSQKYYSHNINIKCVDSTLKCIDFELFHYTINCDVFYQCITSWDQ